jgi:hypothetical protein
LASSALLAVTTWRPASSAARTAGARRTFVAADQLDEDVDVGLRRARPDRRTRRAAQVDAAVAAAVAGGDGGHDDFAAALVG